MKLRVFAKAAGLVAVPWLLAVSQPSLAAGAGTGNCVAAQKGWAGQRWTLDTYKKYTEVFDAGGDHLGDFYDENVFFHDGPGYHGRQAMVDVYRKLRADLKETGIPKTVVIDNDQGLIAVELTTRLEALHDMQMGSQSLKKGEAISFDGVIFYTLKNGCISDIRGRILAAPGQPGGPGASGPGNPGGPPPGAPQQR